MTIIPAITLHQPWATLIALGVKTEETRTWAPRARTGGGYRGPLLIHAAKHTPRSALEGAAENMIILDALNSAGMDLHALPAGVIVAVVVVSEVVDSGGYDPGDQIHFGDYRLNRKIWKLEDVRPFDPPIPAQGYQGIWYPDVLWCWSCLKRIKGGVACTVHHGEVELHFHRDCLPSVLQEAG